MAFSYGTKTNERVFMKKLFALLAALALAGNAMAANLDVGTKEVRLDGHIDGEALFDGEIDANLLVGYFVADSIEVGPYGSLTYNDRWVQADIGFFGQINFVIETSYLVPYLGLGLGLYHVDIDDYEAETGLGLIMEGGTKYFIDQAENVALFAALRGEVTTARVFPTDEDEEDQLDDNNWTINFGVATYFD